MLVTERVIIWHQLQAPGSGKNFSGSNLLCQKPLCDSHSMSPTPRVAASKRFPDPLMNPALGFFRLDDGWFGRGERRSHQAKPDEDLYHLPPEEDALVPTVCHSLDQALEALDVGRSFPHQGRRVHRQHARRLHRLKMGEVTRLRQATHSEFDMYYSL
jgi:glutamine synthetase